MPKVVLVTGATSGIGQAVAGYLYGRGYCVYGTGRSPKSSSAPEGYKLLPMDLSDTDSINEVVNTVLESERRIDVLVNNAGQGVTGALEDASHKDVRSVFQINVFGTLDLIKKTLPTMRKQGEGMILNITSIAAYMGLPFRGVYCASKIALETLTETLRMEVKPFGIRVSSIAPGSFRTDIALRRYTIPVTEDSPYKTAYNEALQLINDAVDSGKDVFSISKKVYKIINTTSPKVHYKLGKPLEELSVVLKRILPDKLFEKILMNHFKLK